MKRFIFLLTVLMLSLVVAGIASATNGDNMMAIGPIARAMGGVGIAAPQDAISATFANPAAMCFGPYCPGSEFNLAATAFMPVAHTRVTAAVAGLDTGVERSDSDFFLIPAIGISTPITSKLRFGFSAYGTSGMGVDYRDKFDLNPMAPGTQDVYTRLQIMKFAPTIAYLITPNLSVGASVHVNQGGLDLNDRAGTSSGWGIGAQVGAIYKNGPVAVGVTYITPSKINHKEVADFDGDGDLDGLKLESPQTIGVGVAVEPIKELLLEANVKWVNWDSADGYSDFGWKDQWIYAIGVQYKPIRELALRAGFNYGKNPVKDNDGWNGATFKTVQGKDVPRFMYEVLRITGFPAIVEKHITAGIGYQISKSISVDVGYTHAFKKRIRETGTYFGSSASVESDLKEDSIDFGITYRF